MLERALAVCLLIVSRFSTVPELTFVFIFPPCRASGINAAGAIETGVQPAVAADLIPDPARDLEAESGNGKRPLHRPQPYHQQS